MVMPASTSALWTTSVPASVCGVVPPAMHMARMLSGSPLRAAKRQTSVPCR